MSMRGETGAPRCWVGVAAAEHVRLGRGAGFMQLCHGKAAPLRRIGPGDRVVYYSPASTMRGTDRLQSFTALGTVRAGVPYQVEMAPGFVPWRRDVDWLAAREVPIRGLLDALDFTRGKANWGYQLRFGIFEISPHDMDVIAAAMRAAVPEPVGG